MRSAPWLGQHFCAVRRFAGLEPLWQEEISAYVAYDTSLQAALPLAEQVAVQHTGRVRVSTFGAPRADYALTHPRWYACQRTSPAR